MTHSASCSLRCGWSSRHLKLGSQEKGRAESRPFLPCAEQGRNFLAPYAGFCAGGFDAIAKVSELADHSRRSCWFRTLLDGRSVFPIANPAMKGKPDESADAMGHRPDGLIVSPSVYQTAIFESMR